MRARLLLLFSAVSLPLARGQEAPALPEMLKEHTSGLGQKFIPVPGTTVLFAQFETSVAEFSAFVKAAGYSWTVRPHFEQGDSHPVVGTNRQDAQAFCNWLTESEQAKGTIKPNQRYRLPTNDEWNAAAGLTYEREEATGTEDRLNEQKKFPWGLDWPPPAGVANLQEKEIPGFTDDYPFTAPVGKGKASVDGLYDLAGNAWEWTWDGQLSSSQNGTVRGGSWAYFKRETLVASYVYEVPIILHAPTIGFRCVFEDKDRTSAMLAALNADRVKAEAKRKAELMDRQKVDPKDVKKVLAGNDKVTPAPGMTDVATLKPAEAGLAYENALQMKFVPVPDLANLLVGKTEVTVGQVEMWAKANARRMPQQPAFNNSANLPAVSINWEDANAFCLWLTDHDTKAKLLPGHSRYRLLRDDEWSTLTGLKNEPGEDPEKKSGKDTTLYPWGTDWPPRTGVANLDHANIPGASSDSHARTAPVGYTTPDGNGLSDLGGNVSEWCEDEWPSVAGDHVIRGASWLMSQPTAALSSSRQHLGSSGTRIDLGFRCVIELIP